MALDRTWYNTLVDDDGSNTVGTIWNKAAVDSLLDSVDAELVDSIVNSSTTGVDNAWTPGGTGDTLVAWYVASGDLTINGMAGGVTGRRVTIRNYAPGTVYVNHNNASGVAGGHLLNPATSGPTPIATNGYATYVHDGTYWLLVAHEQGAWVTPPFSAANFSALASMTWTVAAGGVTICRYRLAGRALTWNYYIQGTAGGTASNNLIVTAGAWGGYSQASGLIAPNCAADAGAGFTAASVAQGGGAAGLAATTIYFSKNAAPNWTLGAVAIAGSLTFEVT